MLKVAITRLGDCRFPSPHNGKPPNSPALFEQAGPRPKLFFDPAKTVAGIVASAVLFLVASGCAAPRTETPPTPTARIVSTNPAPMEMGDGHILVRTSLNGHEAQLVLDTGAALLFVSREVADAAGLQGTWKARATGAGGGRGSVKLAITRTVELGPAAVDNVFTGIAEIPPEVGIDGSVGLSFLRHFTFRMDFERRLLSFAPLESGDLSTNGWVLPLLESGRCWSVLVELDGIPGELLVDVGSNTTTLRSWFVEAQNLRARYPKRLDLVNGRGMFGEMQVELARVKSFKLGGCMLTNVLVEFETRKEENPQRPTFAGFLGMDILKQFNLTFDPAGKRLFLEPNGHPAEPRAFARSGVFWRKSDTNWIVRKLIADSPAGEAGIREGDRLHEVDGKAVDSMQPEDIFRPFRADPGTKVRMRVETKGEAPRDVVLTLRDLL